MGKMMMAESASCLFYPAV